MDNDLIGIMRKETERPSRDLEGATPAPSDCGGTGLCPEAQADGVPCYAAGRSCEICGRARTWDTATRRVS